MFNPGCLQGYDFLDRFIKDLTNIENLGFSKEQTIKMVATLQYVKDFVDTPSFVHSENKLPNGYKLSDGTKYSKKPWKEDTPERYIFIKVMDDLYIHGVFKYCFEIRCKTGGEFKLLKNKDNKLLVIENWRNVRGRDIVEGVGLTPFLHNSLCDYLHRNGFYLGYLKETTTKYL